MVDLIRDAGSLLERNTTRLTDVDTTGKTKEQVYTEREAIWKINTKLKETEHLSRYSEDRAEDSLRGWHKPGHRGGRRVRLVWVDSTTFERWRTKFKGLPAIDTRYSLEIGPAAYENPGDDVTAPSGRRYTEIQATQAEQDWLTINGVTLCNPGSFDPLSKEQTL